MKMTKIEVSNMFGAKNIKCNIEKPIVLFAGDNAAGKSSIQNAVRMAITGAPSRVHLKKDYKQMVTEGHKKASASVYFEDGMMCGADLPKGAATHSDNPVIPMLLEPYTFVSMKPDERRKFLFSLAGIKVSVDDVRERLSKRECNSQKAESILSMLHSGFPAAHDTAKERAKDAKSQWKTVTGEAYGVQKAEGWEPEKVGYDPVDLETALAQLNHIDTELQQLANEKGSLDQQIKAANKRVEKRKVFEVRAENLEQKRIDYENLLTNRDDLGYEYEELKQRQKNESEGYSCPCCGVVLMLKDGALVETVPVDDAIGEIQVDAKKQELSKAQQQMEQAREIYENGKIAAEALAEMTDCELNVEVVENRLSTLDEKINAKGLKKANIAEELVALRDLENKHKAAELSAEQAAGYHKDVIEWLEVAEAFAPDGIPGEYLKEALNPINMRLSSNSCALSWKEVQINGDMEITADNRPFYLLSDSEQWRVTAIIAEAFSHYSGLKMICLDRFDVLEVASRGGVISWLMGLAANGEIDTALIFGTLKQKPADNEQMQCYWVMKGEI